MEEVDFRGATAPNNIPRDLQHFTKIIVIYSSIFYYYKMNTSDDPIRMGGPVKPCFLKPTGLFK